MAVLVALLAALLAARSCAPTPPRDEIALTDELAEITARYSRDWDARRDHAWSDKEYAEKWAEWRRAYRAEIRAAYARHGRPVPSGVPDEDEVRPLSP